MNERLKYGYIQKWSKWPKCVDSADQIKKNKKHISFQRVKDSHRGISNFQKIKYLIAHQVNDDFLEEISYLENLEYLKIEVLTSGSLEKLTGFRKLKTLSIYGIRKAKDFKSLTGIDSLENLFISNINNLNSLDFLSNAHHLKAVGIEGGMYKKQKIDSLKPISGLQKIEALFMATVQLKDKDLTYLATLPNLRILNCARFAPNKRFEELRQCMPKLKCNWCDKYELPEL